MVFDKEWFEKHQRKLVKLANSWIGKHIFQFKKMGHYLENPIIKITPYSVGEIISIKEDEIEIREHFFSRNEYARKLYFVLLPMWYAMHVWDWFVADHFRLAPKLSFGFSTLTKNPGSIAAGNPSDGTVARGGVSESWATIRSSAGTAVADFNNNRVQFLATSTTDQWSLMRRAILNFDTSSLTSSATISATVLSLWGDSGSADAQWTVDVYTNTVADTTALATADYTQFGSTSQTGSPKDGTQVDFTNSVYTDFTFNATGRGNVSKTGISKFAIDVSTTPTWSSGLSRFGEFRGAGFGSNKPTLVVTYTLSSGVSLSLLSLLNAG